MKKLLIVEDDIHISEMVVDYLRGEGFEIIPVYSGKQAVEIFEKERFDLVLIDLMLPEYSGFDIIKHIRKSSIIPIVIITAKDDDADKAMGLNLGADDYVTKPFSIIELSARIKAHIRRAIQYNREPAERIIEVKDLKIYVGRYKVEKEGREISLTHTEFGILALLASNLGRAFSKEQIYNQIWKEPYYGNERVLNSHMNRLRNKLKGQEGTGTEYIKTLWGIGYKMEEE